MHRALVVAIEVEDRIDGERERTLLQEWDRAVISVLAATRASRVNAEFNKSQA